MIDRPKRRFWKHAALRPEGQGVAVVLDDRPLRTPAKAPLILPGRALAQAITEEWNAQGEEIRPDTMPLTRAANAAIDKVRPAHGAVADMLADYGASDLLCYRATFPAGLVQRQAEVWDPLLDWAERALRAPLIRIDGVMPAPQPPASLARLRAEAARHDAFELTALHDLVILSGSLVIGLAASHGALPVDEAWVASRVDEDWQASQWGEDPEALAAAAEKRAAFLAAARLLTLARMRDT